MKILIILNFNDFESVISIVKRVQNYIMIDKIIIVDNCSTDNSYKELTKLVSDKIDLIKTNSNCGYAAGNNYGIKYAIEKYEVQFFLIANPDVIFEEDIITSLEQVYAEKQDAAIVSCMMTYPSECQCVSAWKIPSYFDCLWEQFIILSKLFGNRIGYDKEYFMGRIVPVDAIPGSFFMISRDAFKQIGYFDENTFLYYEENILAYKIKKLGLRNYLVTNKSFIHNHSVSIDKSITNSIDKFRIAYQSRDYYCHQYLKISKMQSFMLKLFFEIGIFNYSVIKRLQSLVRYGKN